MWAMQIKVTEGSRGAPVCTFWLTKLMLSKLTAQVLWPFAMVFDCVDNKGQLIPGVEFTIVHSGFNGEISYPIGHSHFILNLEVMLKMMKELGFARAFDDVAFDCLESK